MKNIRHKSTLVYYDGSQVFEAVDAIGGNYIAVLLDSTDAGDRYLVAGVEPERLRKFRIGALDLRSLLLERAEDEWFLAVVSEPFDGPLTIKPQKGPLAETPYMPDPGFVLHSGMSDFADVGEACSTDAVPVTSDMTLEKRITESPEVMAGKPVIAGTRVAVEFIVELLAQGWTNDDIFRDYPGISAQDIRACLLYASHVLHARALSPAGAQR